MKLYVMPGACSLAAHIALNWADAAYDLVILSHEEVGGDAYRRISPKGVVPALALDDGTVLTEALAVLGYISDAYPHAWLGVTSGRALERAQLNEALADLVTDVHDSWGPVFAPNRFVVDESQKDGARQAAFKRLDQQYARLDELMTGRQWRLFGRRTVADAYLHVMCSWKDKSPTPLAHYPALAAFKARLDADAGVEQAVAAEASAQG